MKMVIHIYRQIVSCTCNSPVAGSMSKWKNLHMGIVNDLGFIHEIKDLDEFKLTDLRLCNFIDLCPLICSFNQRVGCVIRELV